MEPIVLVEPKGKMGVLTMNAPGKLNCLSDDMLCGIYDGLAELEADDDIRAIILRGAGRAFCSGFDLSPREEPFTTIGAWREHAQLGNRTFFAICDCKKPVIGLVQGYAMGGGCDLAMVCDFTIAADTAVLGEPEIQFSSASSFMLMPWAVGMKQARHVLLTGDRVPAARAEEIGMVTSVVPEADLDKAGMELAKKLVKIPVPAMQLNKQNINRAYEIAGIREALLAGEQIFGAVHMTHTPENDAFFAVAAEKGLKEAFKWRDAQFANE